MLTWNILFYIIKHIKFFLTDNCAYYIITVARIKNFKEQYGRDFKSRKAHQEL